MSMLFIDGFNHYDSIAQKWDAKFDVTEVSTAFGRFSAGYLDLAGNGGWAQKNISTSENEIVVGFAYYYEADKAVAVEVWGDAGVQAAFVLYGATGTIEARRGAYNVGTILGSSAAAVITSNTYQYVELRFKVDNTTGEMEVKVDGVQVLNLTGQDTQFQSNSTIVSTRAYSANTAGGRVGRIDDFYILDTAGAAPYNTFLGDVRVSTLRPNAAGASADFTPIGDSANHLTTDELIMDENTTYNRSGIITARDSLNMQAMGDVTGAVGTIYGVQVTNGVEKTDAGSIRFKNALRSGTTYYDGAEYEGTVTYKFRMEMHQVDPDTAVAWTEAGVDAAQSGYVITYKET